ncbi:DUF4145 domain-containing protein [Albidovulum aquaemixtae]|nr:DUF4145 domain-containing protein [Defluviimonas aquaemixtae]
MAIGSCGVCREVALFRLMDRSGADPRRSPITLSENKPLTDNFVLIDISPEPRGPEIPESIPTNVHRTLEEAEQCFHRGIYGAAGSAYRKAMERALKHVNPDATGMLNKRIRDIEKAGLIPSSLIQLLDEVRLFGNEATHEDDWDPEKDDIIAAREFASLFLTYMFSLPAKIDSAKKRRQIRESGQAQA